MQPSPYPSDAVHGLPAAALSRAIGVARILLIIGLVFLHYGNFPDSAESPFRGVDTQEHSLATAINSSILFFFFSAVPLLSMISGWLFFSFTDAEAAPALKRRIKRRVVSLYVPLIIWNMIYLAALYALFRANPNAGPFTHLNRINMNFNIAGWLDYANAIFAVTTDPVAFQFWFVRDLFLTVLVSPLLWLMLRYMPLLAAGGLCLIWLSGWNMLIFVRPDVPFFFYLGALIRRRHTPLVVPLNATILLVAAYITLAILRALAPYAVPFTGDDPPLWVEVATRAMRIVGVMGCWGVISRFAQTTLGSRISAFGGLAFFLHSAHWPLLAVVKIALQRFLPSESDGWLLAHYVASVALTVLIGLGAGLILSRLSPRLFALMNGGRRLEQVGGRGV